MGGIEDQFAADAAEQVAPTTEELAQIGQLADRQIELEDEIAELEQKLKDKAADLKKVAEDLLPVAMKAANCAEYKLNNGAKIAIKDDVFANIRSGMNTEAADWLDGKGLGDVVKDQITINLGKGQSKLAEKLREVASQLGVVAEEKLSVHPSTLKALVKEQLKRGVEFPESCFSVMPYQKAVIVRPKVK